MTGAAEPLTSYHRSGGAALADVAAVVCAGPRIAAASSTQPPCEQDRRASISQHATRAIIESSSPTSSRPAATTIQFP
jgi:hypothetical protein